MSSHIYLLTETNQKKLLSYYHWVLDLIQRHNRFLSPEPEGGNYADDGWVMATAGLIGCGGDTTVVNPVISPETGGAMMLMMVG